MDVVASNVNKFVQLFHKAKLFHVVWAVFEICHVGFVNWQGQVLLFMLKVKRNWVAVNWKVSFHFAKAWKLQIVDLAHYYTWEIYLWKWCLCVVGHFVIMTTWSCQLGICISMMGIVEAERAVTVQIMKNGRPLMLAWAFSQPRIGTFEERMEGAGYM